MSVCFRRVDELDLEIIHPSLSSCALAALAAFNSQFMSRHIVLDMMRANVKVWSVRIGEFVS